MNKIMSLIDGALNELPTLVDSLTLEERRVLMYEAEWLCQRAAITAAYLKVRGGIGQHDRQDPEALRFVSGQLDRVKLALGLRQA